MTADLNAETTPAASQTDGMVGRLFKVAEILIRQTDIDKVDRDFGKKHPQKHEIEEIDYCLRKDDENIA